MSGKGYMIKCTGQLVEFLGREFWTMSYRFFINKGTNNYLKVTNVERNAYMQLWRGRDEVQKNKWTPHYQTELNEKSGNNNRFAPKELLFLTKCGS